MAKLGFHFGRKKHSIWSWVGYSAGTAAAVSLLVHFGNALLSSKHGEFVRDFACSASKAFPDGDISRFLFSFCEAAKDGKIDPDEAKGIIDRGQRVTGIGSDFFDRDPVNLERRAKDEVDYAIDRWKAANPSPRIDPELRRLNPTLDDTQLCVLSQAERYTDGDATGIRYVGMSVCEEDPMSKTTETAIPRPR